MNFCVIVKIAKHRISFWYQTEGNPYALLKIKESHEIPLYFYVKGNDFRFGTLARDHFYANDPDAYGNYFESIKDPSLHFTIYGNKKPVKQLFYFGVEHCLSYFINTVLYKSESIESFRPNFPLRLLFEADIEDPEKTLIESLFREAGYLNLETLDYNKALLYVLHEKGLLNAAQFPLVLQGIDNNLYLQGYKTRYGYQNVLGKVENQGADPRVRILAALILEYITAQNTFLSINKEQEIASLLPFCADLLKKQTSVIKGEAILGDGKSHWFRITERNLNEQLLYATNDTFVTMAITEQIAKASSTIENTILLLRSPEINTSYFIDNLLKKYPSVRGITLTDHDDTMEYLFAQLAASGYSVSKAIPGVPSVPAVTAVHTAKPVLPSINTRVPPLPPKNNKPVEKNITITIPKVPEPKNNPVLPKKTVVLPPLPPKKQS